MTANFLVQEESEWPISMYCSIRRNNYFATGERDAYSQDRKEELCFGFLSTPSDIRFEWWSAHIIRDAAVGGGEEKEVTNTHVFIVFSARGEKEVGDASLRSLYSIDCYLRFRSRTNTGTPCTSTL